MSTKGYNQPTLVKCVDMTSNADSTTAKTPGSVTERSASGMPGIASGPPEGHTGRQSQQSSVGRSRPRHPAHSSHFQMQRKYDGRNSLNKRSQPHWRSHWSFVPDRDSGDWSRPFIQSTRPTKYPAAHGAIMRHHGPVRGRTSAWSSNYTDPAAQLQAKTAAEKFLSELASELTIKEVLRTSHSSSHTILSKEDVNARPSVLHDNERPCTKSGSVTEEVTDHNTNYEPSVCCEDTTATGEQLRLQHKITSLKDEIESLQTGCEDNTVTGERLRLREQIRSLGDEIKRLRNGLSLT